jgi:hypothetical protein
MSTYRAKAVCLNSTLFRVILRRRSDAQKLGDAYFPGQFVEPRQATPEFRHVVIKATITGESLPVEKSSLTNPARLERFTPSREGEAGNAGWQPALG